VRSVGPVALASETRPQPPPAYVVAATDERPIGERERKLCAKASDPDWLYLGALLALDVGSIALDSSVLQVQGEPGIRLLGPAAVGLTWGATIGGGYLSLPKCSPDWVASPPIEGEARTSWPVAASLALLAGATAPLIVGLETGTGGVTVAWPIPERSARLVVAGVAGVTGALVPYLIPPKTWRAAKELWHIRAGADAHGAFFAYHLTF
jgi:hypothetical protein